MCVSKPGSGREPVLCCARALVTGSGRERERKREREMTTQDSTNSLYWSWLARCPPSWGFVAPLSLSQFSVRPRLFLSCTQRERERERELYIPLYTYTSIYRRLGSSMFSSLPFRAPPDLFPMSPTQPTLLLWPWSFSSNKFGRRQTTNITPKQTPR